MTDFLLCIGRYVVEMAALALIGGLGAVSYTHLTLPTT